MARVLRRLGRSPRGLVGLALILVVVGGAVLAPWIAPYGPLSQDLAHTVQPPSASHWLGTDQFGRDILSRLLYGARISLEAGFLSVVIGVVLGIAVGMLAGFYGGFLDNVLMAANDILLGFRTYLMAIMVVAILGPSLINLTIAIGLSTFPQFARMIRAEVLSARERDFVEAARALGARDLALMVRHVLPQVLAPLVVMATFFIATAIVVQSSLSFLGLGSPPPTPSWGLMISEGRTYIMAAPWLPTIPGLAIMITVLGFNLLGDTLRDVLDPRLRT